jgi:hypothetical protein
VPEVGLWRVLVGWVAVVLVAAGVWVWLADGRRGRRAEATDVAVGWWLWHFFTGGRLETGPSFPSERGRAAKVGLRVGLAAARTGVAGGLGAWEYLRAGAPYGRDPWVVAVAGVVTALVLAVVLWLVVRLVVVWWHWRRWIRPLHLALFAVAGWPEDKRPRSYLRVPRDRAAGGDGVVVGLPPTFVGKGTQRELIGQVVRDKLDLGDVSVNWVLRGRHAYVQFRPRSRVPDRAFFSDPAVRAEVAKAKASAPLIGLTHGNRPVAVDLDSESPHVLLSAGTGGGKSSTIRTLAAQLMHNGAAAWVIDAKRHSHAWLRDVPGVRYFRDVGEIHHALIELGREGHRRNVAFDDVGLDEAGPRFQRRVVICEEMNATMGMLKQWWRDNREPGGPPTSPAIVALGQLLFMGRAVRIHVLAVAQLASAKDLGGPEQRENYAVRILARYTANAWKMLVPECEFSPSTRHPGRAQVCIGGIATETQIVHMNPKDARAWALAGTPVDHASAGSDPVDVAVSRVAGDPVSQGKQPATVAGPPDLTIVGNPTDTPADGPVSVSLAQASVDRGDALVRLRHDALRQAARRDPEFPAPVGRRGQTRLYAPEALRRWERNRPGVKGQAG